MPVVKLRQEEINVQGKHFLVTRIPTAISGSWYTVHDVLEVWASVAIDFDGTIIGWHNPPNEKYRADMEEAIKRAFGIPKPL